MFSRLIKKLDILIIKAFLGPLLATFLLTAFVLTLQVMWLYIDDFVGKGLDAWTILRWLTYVAGTSVPLALPLAVLLSSIMTLGNLGETYELVAIKSAGISLLRFLRPLCFVTILITGVAFFFSNNVLPIANLKMQSLKSDILYSKPAFDIKEGVFYDKIEGFVIKIGKKEKDDSTIRNVVIYEQNNSGQQDNMIIADSGTMVVSPDKRNLFFTLKDGWRYQEKGNRTAGSGTELIRMGFRRYKKVMDLTSLLLRETNDSMYKGNYLRFNIAELGHAIDSIRSERDKFRNLTGTSAAYNLKFPAYLDTTGWDIVQKKPDTRYLLKTSRARDSLRKIWVASRKVFDSTVRAQDSIRSAQKALAKKTAAPSAKPKPPGQGPSAPASTAAAPSTTATTSTAAAPSATATNHTSAPPSGGTPTPPPGTVTAPSTATAANTDQSALLVVPAPPSKNPPDPVFADILPDSVRMRIMESSIATINATKTSMFQPEAQYEADDHNMLVRQMAWHEKLTMAIACFVMFLIGAPLGSIIRKGGIGMPLVFAVIFFVIFFLLNNFGKKLTGQSVLTPIGGEWMATYVLAPVGLFLIYKALHDSQLFNKEFYFRLSRKIRPLFTRKAK